MLKKRMISIFLLIVLLFSGCKQKPLSTDSLIDYDECRAIEQVGQIPETFQYIIENNLFYGITAFDGRLLKAEVSSADEQNKILTHKICMMDVYGNDLAEYVCCADDAYRVTTLTVTTDDGFLFVLGFEDYAYEQGTWASNKGFASRVIKCDKNGNVQFDTAFDRVEGRALQYCFEKNGLFYFFGTRETPETKKQGIGSPSDIYMTILDQNGTVLKKQCIAGSGFDSLHAAEISGDTFILTVSSQSDDGDFAGSRSKGYPVDWVITVSDDLEIIKMKKKVGRDWFDERIGEKNGAPVYQSDELFCDFDAGRVEAFIDYGDFYLIVSENETGIYENTPPAISSIWYYTETVYSAYDSGENLLFRASVDSSPDYDTIVKKFEIQ